MDHWFDALSRSHDRRTALKGAAVAGGALLLPFLRVPTAWATEREPCFTPCQQAAKDRWNASRDMCRRGTDASLSTVAATGAMGNLPLAALLSWLGAAETASCMNTGELAYHRAALACRGSECGNPEKYPGGATKPKPPPPKCDPIEEKACGDICCNVITDCCSSKKGGYVCYAAGYNCEGA
jgi:hypothetical protein